MQSEVSKNIKFEWLPVFEIGVPEIDDAHRHLFLLANEISEAIERQDRALCRVRIQAFIEASESHFAAEEKFLARVGYFDTESHRQYHATLLTKAKKIKQVCDDEMDRGVVNGQCYREVMAFLIDDVIRGDRSFKSYLDDQGLTRGN